MEWVNVSIRTSHEAMEVISNMLIEMGAAGTAIDDPALLNRMIDSGEWDYTDLKKIDDPSVVTVTAYFPADSRYEARTAAIKTKLSNLSASGLHTAPAEITLEFLRDEDWSETWKRYFHTEKIVAPSGKSITIKPTWEDYETSTDETIIEIDPGAAFGTGTHPTTSMCLRALADMNLRDKTVADVGTGSGILAIAAAKLGAKKIVAVDNDPTAVKVAAENVRQNNATVELRVGDLLKDMDIKADVIIANIIADIIIRLLPQAHEILKVGGCIVASGIIDERANDVTKAADANGFAITTRNAEKGWVQLTLTKTMTDSIQK